MSDDRHKLKKRAKYKKKLSAMRTVKQWSPEKLCIIHPWKFSRPD